PPPRPIQRRDALDRRLGADRDALPPARLEQSFVIKRRMQARRALDDHAAMVIIARDLRALLVARHHIRPGLRRIVEPREALFLIGVMLWRPRADKPPALLPIALDLLVLDEPLDQRERIGRIGEQRIGAFRRHARKSSCRY